MAAADSPPCYVACVGIIGPDNNPMLIQKTCPENEELEIDTLLFCCLDFFDPPGAARKPSSKSSDRFLGNIQTSDRFQIWGYRAGLGYKIVILTLHIVSFQDSAIRPLCEAVRDILFDAVMDPFYVPFAVIDAPGVMDRILAVTQSLRPPTQ
jgi:hypothetical protein